MRETVAPALEVEQQVLSQVVQAAAVADLDEQQQARQVDREVQAAPALDPGCLGEQALFQAWMGEVEPEARCCRLSWA